MEPQEPQIRFDGHGSQQLQAKFHLRAAEHGYRYLIGDIDVSFIDYLWRSYVDYSADQHDDIYPYATFELHRDRPRSPMKMLDNPPVPSYP